MSNLARKLQQEQQMQQEQKQKITGKKQRKEGFFWLSPGEKVLGMVFCATVVFGAVNMISNHASIYEVNKDIQATSIQIQEQAKVNRELEMQIGELSTPERINAIAKQLGLKLNENNVKVVQ